MTARTFPPTGDPAETAIKTKAGYVQYAAFAGQRAGYFCGTCPAFHAFALGQRDGYCTGLKVPVTSFGCCNNWRLAPRDHWVGADGMPL